MKTPVVVALVMFMSTAVVRGEEFYVVEINPDTGKEVSGYGPVTEKPDRIEFATGYVRVFVTKEEYDADKDVQPEERLKAIPKAKIDDALADAERIKAGWSAEQRALHEALKKQNTVRPPVVVPGQ